MGRVISYRKASIDMLKYFVSGVIVASIGFQEEWVGRLCELQEWIALATFERAHLVLVILQVAR